MKPSCKSQYLAIHHEAKALFSKGYSKKTIYDHFIEKDKIHMSYVAWAKIMENHDQRFPFGQKKAPKETIIRQGQGKLRGKFSHSNDPYPPETDFVEEEKENEKPFTLIKKGE